MRLAPLPVPEAGLDEADITAIPSVQLVIERASSQDESIVDLLESPETSETIAEICRRLDGIPLALELAASRLATLSPEVVLNQLESGHGILSSQRNDRPERQRTMHTAIAWSFQLLPEETQQVFLRLAPFAAGFGLDIVERIVMHLKLTAYPIDVVSELMYLNLIRRVSGGATPWYAMLVSMREFCLAELNVRNQRQEAEEFVAQHVAALANVTEARLTGPDSAEWIATLDREFATIRSSVAWAISQEQPELPMKVAKGMWRFLEREGRWRELVDWVNQSLQWREKLDAETLIGGLLGKLTAVEDAREISVGLETARDIELLLESHDYPDLRTTFMLRMGALEHDQQHLDEAEAWFHKAAQQAENHDLIREAAVALANLGLLAYQRHDWDNANDWLTRSKNHLAELGDELGVASSLNNLGALSVNTNQLEKAQEYLEESLAITRRLGLRRDLIYTLLNLASLLSRLEQLDEAEILLTEAIHHSKEIHLPALEAAGVSMLAIVELDRSNSSAAAGFISRALELVSPEESPRQYPELGIVTARLLAQNGKHIGAAAILAKAVQYAAETEYSFEPHQMDQIGALKKQIAESSSESEDKIAEAELWSTEEFVRQLKLAARRTGTYSAAMVMKIPETQTETRSEFTNREREILQLLYAGESTQSMADLLSVSPRTVTTHIGNMMTKMGVNSRAELIAKTLVN